MASWKWNEMLEHCYQPHVNSGHSVFVSCDLFTDFRSNDRLELLSYYSTASWSAVKGATARAENFILIFDRMIGWNYCYQLRVNFITQQHPEVPSKAQQRELEILYWFSIEWSVGTIATNCVWILLLNSILKCRQRRNSDGWSWKILFRSSMWSLFALVFLSRPSLGGELGSSMWSLFFSWTYIPPETRRWSYLTET